MARRAHNAVTLRNGLVGLCDVAVLVGFVDALDFGLRHRVPAAALIERISIIRSGMSLPTAPVGAGAPLAQKGVERSPA